MSLPVQLVDRITLTSKVLRVRDISWKRQAVDRAEIAMIVREHDGRAFGLDRHGAVVTRMRPIWSARQLARLSAALGVPFEDLGSKR